jgi:general secretion pathway protein G
MSKRRKTWFGRKHRRGLTLIDVMVTVTIVALFSAVAGVQAFKMFQDAQLDAARVEVKNLGDALDHYRLKRYAYPSTTDGLAVLTTADLMKEIPRDPWGNAYVYVSPGEKHPKRFDLFSKGPDGVEHTEDDIW